MVPLNKMSQFIELQKKSHPNVLDRVRRNIIRESNNYDRWEEFIKQAQYNLHRFIDGVVDIDVEGYQPAPQIQESYTEIDEWMDSRNFLLWLAEGKNKPKWLEKELVWQLLKAE